MEGHGEISRSRTQCAGVDKRASESISGSGYQAPPAGLNFPNPELEADLIDDGPTGAKWLEMFRQYEVEIGAMNRFTDSIVTKTDELLTPVGVKE